MEKKSKIKIATFWGIIFASMGLKTASGASIGNSTGDLIVFIFVAVVIPLIGIGLLSWIAGELYKGK